MEIGVFPGAAVAKTAIATWLVPPLPPPSTGLFFFCKVFTVNKVDDLSHVYQHIQIQVIFQTLENSE